MDWPGWLAAHQRLNHSLGTKLGARLHNPKPALRFRGAAWMWRSTVSGPCRGSRGWRMFLPKRIDRMPTFTLL